MAKKPVIFMQGKRLYLRPLEVADAERCRRWINDPAVWHNLGQRIPVGEERQMLYLKGDPGPHPAKMSFAIVLNKRDRHIGILSLGQIEWINGNASTGMYIGEEEYRGAGYGHEAKELLLAYAFDVLRLHRLSSRVFSTNAASIACLKKSGYKEEGRQREVVPSANGWHDDILFGLLAHEWRAKRDKREAKKTEK